MSPTLKKIIVFIVLFSLAVFLIGQRLEKPETVPETYTVRVLEPVRSPYFLPQYLALNLGFFKEQNLNVNISTTSPEAIRAALADGRTDVALCGLQKIVFNPSSKGTQPKVFATMAARDGSFLMGRKDSGDFQWQELKNKTIIGGSQDDSSEIALENVLRSRSLYPFREVTIYHNIPDKLRIGAFRADTGHYIQLLEPDATMAEFKGYGQVVTSVGEAAGDMVVTAYAALPSYIQAKPEAIQQFTNAIYKAQLWLCHHSAEEAATVAAPSFPDLDREILLKCIERYRSLEIWTDNPLVPRESYERFHNAAKEAGEMASPAPYETTVIIDFAHRAMETVVYTPEGKKPKKTPFPFF